MAQLKGITVTLYEKTLSGTDDFNHSTYVETPVSVDNVLVGQPTAQEVLNILDLYGKKAIYTLAIPKGDEHRWEDCKVVFFGKVWRTFGIPLEGIECNIPLDWNKKVMVERYE